MPENQVTPGESAASPRLITLLHGPDKTGLVARVSNWIFERGGNILHADQHSDLVHRIFFQRIEWDQPGLGEEEIKELANRFRAFAHVELGMTTATAVSNARPRVVLMVSKANHALHDLMLNWKAGDLPCEITSVISNHDVLQSEVESYGVRFHHIPVRRETKLAAETQQLEILKSEGADLAVMARYMQILSDGFLGALARPVINIHHSFLPAFAGARPYHQAHLRGVKLIGATAHYATSDLDEGPIIHQAVERVTHRHGVDDMVRLGRDLEKRVLSQAVRWHLQNRILVYKNRTVVFD